MGNDWTVESIKWERADVGECREEEESDGCLSVSGSWSCASWDSWTFCQHSTPQNQSQLEKKREKEKDTCALLCTQSIHTLYLIFFVLVQLQQGILSMLRQCDSSLLWFDHYAGRKQEIRSLTFPKFRTKKKEQKTEMSGILYFSQQTAKTPVHKQPFLKLGSVLKYNKHWDVL